MIAQLRGLLGQSDRQHPGRPEPAIAAPARVELYAYAEDSILTGSVVFAANRLTDALNDAAELRVTNAALLSLADASTTQVDAFTVLREELLAVRGVPQKSVSGRAIRVIQYPVELTTGPYTVRGYLSGAPGVDPTAGLHRRKQFVPITKARIEYALDGVTTSEEVDTLIVNRLHLLSLHLTERVLSLETAHRPLAEDDDGLDD